MLPDPLPEPLVVPAWSSTRPGGWAVVFTPTDPETSGIKFCTSRRGAELFRKRLIRRRQRDAEWTDRAFEALGVPRHT